MAETAECAEPVEVRGLSGDEVSIVIHTPYVQQIVEGTDILVATGRVPNTTGIGLNVAGVALDSRGYLLVNERLETTAPDVLGI